MSWLLAAVAAVAAGIAIGRTFAAAQDAHQMFRSYRTRSSQNRRIWLGKSTKTAVLVAVFALVLYLAFRVSSG